MMLQVNSGSSGLNSEAEGENAAATEDVEDNGGGPPVGEVAESRKPTVAEWARAHYTPHPTLDGKSKCPGMAVGL